MTEEEKKALEVAQTEREKAVAEDVAAMDETNLRPKEESFEEQPAEADESSDIKVAEAGPDDLVKEIQEAVAKEELGDAVEGEDDGYDFSFINELARQALGQPKQEAPVAPTPTPAPAPVAPEAAPIVMPQAPLVAPVQVSVPQDLVTVDEMTAAFDSPQKMVELLQKVYLQARSDAVVDAVQQSLMALPNAVRPVLAKETAFVEMVKNFYQENPELNNYRDFVRYCAVQVENEHPEWSPQDVMKETAKVAKKRLPMLREAMHRESRQSKPSFVDQRGPKTKPSGKKLSRLEQELASMPDY